MSDEAFDVEFEDDILSQCMRDAEYLKTAMATVEGHHFSTEQHTWLWEAIRSTWESSAELASIGIITSQARAEFDDLDERAAALAGTGYGCYPCHARTRSPAFYSG